MKKLSIPITAGLIVTALCGCKDAHKLHDDSSRNKSDPKTDLFAEVCTSDNDTFNYLKSKLREIRFIEKHARISSKSICYYVEQPDPLPVDKRHIICSHCGTKTTLIDKDAISFLEDFAASTPIETLNEIAEKESMGLLFSLDTSDYCGACSPTKEKRKFKLLATYLHPDTPEKNITVSTPLNYSFQLYELINFLKIQPRYFDLEKDIFTNNSIMSSRDSFTVQCLNLEAKSPAAKSDLKKSKDDPEP